MKKLFTSLLFIMVVFLCGCRNSDIESNLEKELASIREGEISFSDFDIYEKMRIKDTNVNINLLDTNVEQIFKDMSYDVTDIKSNKNNSLASVTLKVKDIDAILSDESLLTELIILYENYIINNPEIDNVQTDMYLIQEIINKINVSDKFVEVKTNISLYYSEQDKKWSISFDELLIDALLGKMENKYVINLNDIYRNLLHNNTDIDYDKILNLPDSNKTTRSNMEHPIRLNKTAYFDNSDYFNEKDRYELSITVRDVIRGSEAHNKVIKASTKNNKILKDDQEYIIFNVEVKVENNLTKNPTITINNDDFSLIDIYGNHYNNCIIFGLNSFEPISNNTLTNGEICFIVDEDVETLLLFKDYMNNMLCFSEK